MPRPPSGGRRIFGLAIVRMSLLAREIAAVVGELSRLAGARVGTVRVHAERALTIELAGATLLISAEPSLSRLHAVERRPPRPPHPCAFQALLRRELSGARLGRIEARHGERIVELFFARGLRSGEEIEKLRTVRLIAELSGREGNLFLVGPGGDVLACAGRDRSGRGLKTGSTYRYPPPRFASEEPPPQAPHPDIPGAREGPPFPLSAAIAERYEILEAERATLEGRRRLREPVRAAIARAGRALERLIEEAARIPRAELDRRRADLLKQNLHAVPRGAREVVLTEWTAEGAREATVAMDPSLSARDNMERYYRRYRRIVESAERVNAREREVRLRKGALEELLSAITSAALDELPRLEREARGLGASPRASPRPRREGPPAPYRLFRSAGGARLLVGRNAEGNDVLAVKTARGNDLWLHARGRAGAHVVARQEGKNPVDGETLLDAAHLAAHFSDARGEPQVEVIATRAKYVRRVKGAPAGSVTFSQERTILLRLEAHRLERLLASEED